jgi:chromosome segregation ATPase
MKALLVLSLLLGTTGVKAAKNKNMTKLAEKIVYLRAQVESLNSQLQADREELSNELKSHSVQLTQLKSQIGQEEVRQKQINEKIKAAKEELTTLSANDETLEPFTLKKIEWLRNHVQNGIPFQSEKRMKGLEDIEAKLKSKILTPESAMSRLWSVVEDEMRLSRENALHRQTIRLNGEERLATVAKIGMVLMYFHTVDNRVGSIAKNIDGSFIYVEEHDQEKKELIFKLVDGLKKQIRHGEYILPVAMK